MRLRLAPRAERDLEAILSYIEQHSESGAANVAEAVSRSFSMLRQSPRIARKDRTLKAHVFKIPDYPYLIYYEVGQDAVIVLHIRHTSRRPLKSKPTGR